MIEVRYLHLLLHPNKHKFKVIFLWGVARFYNQNILGFVIIIKKGKYKAILQINKMQGLDYNKG